MNWWWGFYMLYGCQGISNDDRRKGMNIRLEMIWWQSNKSNCSHRRAATHIEAETMATVWSSHRKVRMGSWHRTGTYVLWVTSLQSSQKLALKNIVIMILGLPDSSFLRRSSQISWCPCWSLTQRSGWQLRRPFIFPSSKTSSSFLQFIFECHV